MYAQARQNGTTNQSAWIGVQDTTTGTLVWQSYFDQANPANPADWLAGAWAGPGFSDENYTEGPNTTITPFTTTPGSHTYALVYHAGSSSPSVSYRYSTLDVQVSIATTPNLVKPLS